MRMRLALGLYLIAGLVEICLGATYFTAKQFMSYHAEAVGIPWKDVDGAVQTLFLALMKLAGGGWLALGFCTIAFSLATFKTQSFVARWTLPAATLIAYSASFAATWRVHQATGASTPWAPSLAHGPICVIRNSNGRALVGK